jgi:CHAT domain-containing protein/Flp pilus assembly protein TadD
MKAILLTIFSLFLLYIGFTQQRIPDFKTDYEIGNSFFNSDNPTEKTDSLAVEYLEKSLISSPTTRINAYERYDASKKLGIIHQTYSRYKKSLTYYQKSIAIAQKYSLKDSLLFEPNLFCGEVQYYFNHFDSCYFYLNKAEKIYTKYPKIDHAESLFNTFGVLYFESGNYQQSINYYNKAQRILKEQGKRNENFAMKSNIATSLRLLGKHQEALEIYESIINEEPNENRILINIASTYLGLNETDKALALLEKVKEINNFETQIVFQNRLGQVYFMQKNYAKALTYLKNAIVIQRTNQKGNENNKTLELGNTYNLLGDIAQLEKKWGEALYYYQNAIYHLDFKSQDGNVFVNPTNFSSNINNVLLLKTLLAKGDCFGEMYHKKDKSKSYFNGAVDAYESTFQLINYLLKQYDNEEARFFLTEKINPFFDAYFNLLIDGSQHFRDEKLLKDAFVLSERSKSCILGINLNENKFKNQSVIPDSLLLQERLLRISKTKFTVSAKNDLDSTKKQELNDIEVKLSRIQNVINEFEAKQNDQKKWGIEDLKKQHITDKRVILSIYKAQENYHLFLITKTGLFHEKLGEAKQIDFLINLINEKIADNLYGKTFSGTPQCHLLYQKLIKPLESHLKSTDEIIIIPHYETVRLPFEILLDSQEEFLVKKWRMCYEYSADILLSNAKQKGVDFDKLLIYAPFSNEASEGFLPASVKEINTLKGEKILDKDATKQSFISKSAQYSIIHLSTHAQADNLIPEKSYISFYPSSKDTINTRLYSEEIKLLNLHHTNLLFLSACETSAGKQAKNEGIMSLTRAFSLSGCNNIITSLWKAEDEATAYISEHFYEYLDDGDSVAESLQKAKIDLLEDPKMAQYHSPTYWGHLILVGVPQESFGWNSLMVILGVLVMGVGIFFKFRLQ